MGIHVENSETKEYPLHSNSLNGLFSSTFVSIRGSQPFISLTVNVLASVFGGDPVMSS
jgi:hypothetical protein